MNTVVIAAFHDGERLTRCLDALVDQLRAAAAALVVASNYPVPEAIRARVPGPVQWLEYPATTTVPRLRAHGLSAAPAANVYLLEDHCRVGADWLASLEHALRDGHPVVGGPIDVEPPVGCVARAAFLLDYAELMPPVPSGPVPRLSGANVAYARPVLETLADQYRRDGFHESVLHERLREGGQLLHLDAAAGVRLMLCSGLGEVFASCFYHGRLFAGMRFRRGDLTHRALLACGAILLPLVFLIRIARILCGRGRMAGFGRAFPALALLATAWSAGELAGYLAGPGRSETHWV